MGSLIVAVVGLVLTIVLITPYRPLGPWSPFNTALVFGPILLAAGAASFASRPGKTPGRPGSAARKVTAFGLVLLFVGGCPWVYTPVFSGGRFDSTSGMLGTIIFLLVGVPGLAITLVGLVNQRSQKPFGSGDGTGPDA